MDWPPEGREIGSKIDVLNHLSAGKYLFVTEEMILDISK